MMGDQVVVVDCVGGGESWSCNYFLEGEPPWRREGGTSELMKMMVAAAVIVFLSFVFLLIPVSVCYFYVFFSSGLYGFSSIPSL